MTKEVEDIIREKAFFELTPEELILIKEFAQDEEEYANMKWFLDETKATFDADKIEAPKELKGEVMSHLTSTHKKKGYWLNSVGVFLMPEGRPMLRKPAFQLGIAAVAILGFLFLYDNSNELYQETIVQNVVEEKNAEQSHIPAGKEENFEEVDNESDQQEMAIKEEVDDEQLEIVDELSKTSNEKIVRDEPILQEELILETEEDEVQEVVADEVNMNRMDYSFDSPQTDDIYVPEKELSPSVMDSISAIANTFAQPTTTLSSTHHTVPENADLSFSEVTAVRAKKSMNAEAKASEEILPKSLHINATKELNLLFFTEK